MKQLSHREPGVRPSCSLPYELYADGSLSQDRTGFELRLIAGQKIHGKHSAGAPFNVHLRNTVANKTMNKADMTVATYVVRAGDTLTETFPLSLFAEGQYSIDVHGQMVFIVPLQAALMT